MAEPMKVETMKMSEVFSDAEKKILLRALNALYSSELRAKTKHMNDDEMVVLINKRLKDIQNVTNKELFK